MRIAFRYQNLFTLEHWTAVGRALIRKVLHFSSASRGCSKGLFQLHLIHHLWYRSLILKKLPKCFADLVQFIVLQLIFHLYLCWKEFFRLILLILCILFKIFEFWHFYWSFLLYLIIDWLLFCKCTMSNLVAQIYLNHITKQIFFKILYRQKEKICTILFYSTLEFKYYVDFL